MREYLHQFSHPAGHTLSVPASGETPCKAKNAAFTDLQRRVREASLPDNDWRLVSQQEV